MAQAKALPKEETVADVKQTVPEPNIQVQDVKSAPQGCEAYRSLLSQYNWDISIAMAVMQAESSCDPTQLSPTADRGLMQINAVHADMVNGNLDALYDPTTNIQVAYRVYLSQGWNGWSAYKSGAYLKFL